MHRPVLRHAVSSNIRSLSPRDIPGSSTRLAPFRLWMSERNRLRHMSTSTDDTDIRKQIMSGVKEAMKAKDTFTSTVLRSVLADIQTTEKSSSSGQLSNPAVTSVIRKAITRRTDSASQFTAASRPDLAAVETREAELLTKFLPPLLSQTEIDTYLRDIIVEEQRKHGADNPKKVFGQVLKTFYVKVDKSSVDGQLVKKRAEELLSLTK